MTSKEDDKDLITIDDLPGSNEGIENRKKGQRAFRPLPTSKLLKHYLNDIKWVEDSEGELQPELVVDGLPIQITEEQKLALKKKLQDIKKAKSRRATAEAVQLKSFTKSSMDTLSPAEILQNRKIRAHAIVHGMISRYQVRKTIVAATLIQRWYRDMLPLRRTFKAYYEKLLKARKMEIQKKTKTLDKAKTQLELTILVQHHVLMYKELVKTQVELQTRAALPIQNFVRMHKCQFKMNVIEAAAQVVQNSVRMHLVRMKDDMSLELQIQNIKLSILKYYEVLCAPYTRRALFIYNTRNVSRNTYQMCIEELRFLQSKNDRFMNQKAFRKHMTFILKQLMNNSRNPQLQSIVRSVFQPEIVYRDALGYARHANNKGQRIEKSGWLSRFRKKKKQPKKPFDEVVDDIQASNENALIIENPTALDGGEVENRNELPFGYILKEMVKLMFSSESTIQRANYSTVIMFNFVMTSLIQNPSSMKQKSGAYKSALKKVASSST
mmetsp:Transcript_7887/g.11696  ORF Transcript_7887/g.11696 Transcript_7887/m.11696 type:complete len:496 (+) Transcript_7887:31-1518(+)